MIFLELCRLLHQFLHNNSLSLTIGKWFFWSLEVVMNSMLSFVRIYSSMLVTLSVYKRLSYKDTLTISMCSCTSDALWFMGNPTKLLSWSHSRSANITFSHNFCHALKNGSCLTRFYADTYENIGSLIIKCYWNSVELTFLFTIFVIKSFYSDI